MASAPEQDPRDYMALAAANPPLFIDGDGYGWVPQVDGPRGQFVYRGFRLAHWPMPGFAGVVIHMLGGIEDDPSQDTDAVLFTLTRPGLQKLISDLQAIDASLEVPK